MKASPRPDVSPKPDAQSQADEGVTTVRAIRDAFVCFGGGLGQTEEELAAYDAHRQAADSAGVILKAAREAQDTYRRLTAQMWAGLSGALQESDVVKTPLASLLAQLGACGQSGNAPLTVYIDDYVIRATEEAQRDAGHEFGRFYQQLSESREELRRGLAQQAKAHARIAAEVRNGLLHNTFDGWE